MAKSHYFTPAIIDEAEKAAAAEIAAVEGQGGDLAALESETPRTGLLGRLSGLWDWFEGITVPASAETPAEPAGPTDQQPAQ